MSLANQNKNTRNSNKVLLQARVGGGGVVLLTQYMNPGVTYVVVGVGGDDYSDRLGVAREDATNDVVDGD